METITDQPIVTILQKPQEPPKLTEFSGMTIKQRKWVKLYIKLGNATEAAMRVYDCSSREYAAQIGFENVKKLDYSDFLEQAGITDQLLSTKITEGLNSTKPIGALVLIRNGKDGRPEQILKDDEGMIEVADNPTRHKYLETVLKLKQRFVEKSEVKHSGVIQFEQLNDNELDTTISTKIRQIETATVISGEGTENIIEPTEVRQEPPKTEGIL